MLLRFNPCTPPTAVAGAHATALLKIRLHKSVRLGSESHISPQQKTHLCLMTKVCFLNEARLRRMKTLR